MTTINIARDYTTTPGARYITDGPFSGEEFRKLHLEKLMADPKAEVTILLDGTEGYATSFLEEAFGGLARMFGPDRCLRALKFVSEEEPLLIDEIQEYIREAK